MLSLRGNGRKQNGDGLKEVLGKANDFLKKTKLVSKAIKGISSIVPHPVASSVGSAVGSAVDSLGYGKKKRRRVRKKKAVGSGKKKRMVKKKM